MIVRLKSTIETWNLENERVFLRADLNVPLKDKKILNDFRLQAIIPTITLLQKKEAKIIIGTHLGRPEGAYDDQLSTQHLMPWFKHKGYAIIFAKSIEQAYTQSLSDQHTIVLLENLRFFAQEQKPSEQFAQSLKELGDYYANDGFAVMHRHDTSVTLLPKLYNADKRSIGLLVEKELNALNSLLENPKRPFMIVLGGGKLDTKLAVIEHLLNTADGIFLCPAIVLPFLKVLVTSSGNLPLDDISIERASKIIDQSKTSGAELYFPEDYLVADTSLEGNLSTVDAQSIPTNAVIMAIGPKTIKKWEELLATSGSIFFNSAMGFPERPQTQKATEELLAIMAKSKAFTVVGGGDSVMEAIKTGYDKSIDFLSTGGGATLVYLSGQPLPGLAVFNE